MTQNTTKVVLKNAGDWFAWYRELQANAIAYHVWKFIEPSGTDTLEPPRRPTINDVLQEATPAAPPNTHSTTARTVTTKDEAEDATELPLAASSSTALPAVPATQQDASRGTARKLTPSSSMTSRASAATARRKTKLTVDQKRFLNELHRKYSYDLDDYCVLKEGLASVTSWMKQTVSKKLKALVQPGTLIRERVAIYKAHLARPVHVETEEARVKYRRALHSTASMDPSNWYSRWLKAYTDAVRFGICEIDGTTAIFDFIHAVAVWYPFWSESTKLFIMETQLSGGKPFEGTLKQVSRCYHQYLMAKQRAKELTR